MFRLEPLDRAAQRGAKIYAVMTDGRAHGVVDGGIAVDGGWHAQLGAVGCAEGPLAVALHLAAGMNGSTYFFAHDRSGASARVGFREVPGPRLDARVEGDA